MLKKIMQLFRRESCVGSILDLSGLSELRTITTNSAEISYRIIGHGPALLMLPGAQMTLYAWDVILIQQLAKRFQVILPDYPGINASVMHSGEFTVAGLAKIFAEFIDALHLKSVTVVGYSMGGWIAQWLTIHYAAHLANLVLIASDAGGARVPPHAAKLLAKIKVDLPRAQRYQLITEALFTPQALTIVEPKLQALLKSAGELAIVSPAILNQEYRLAEEWYQGPGCYTSLSRIEIPTVVMVGIVDRIIHRQNGVLLTNGIPNARLVEYATGGHGIIYQYPLEIAFEISKLII